MKTIWKFQVNPQDIAHLEMPEGSEILTVQSQQNNAVMWAVVDTTNKMVERLFEVFGTGHSIPEINGHSRKYIGTFQVFNGTLVFHVFELIKNQKTKQ